jgi:hypothetical protein
LWVRPWLNILSRPFAPERHRINPISTFPERRTWRNSELLRPKGHVEWKRRLRLLHTLTWSSWDWKRPWAFKRAYAIYLSMYLPIYLSINLSIHPSIYLCIYLSIYLSMHIIYIYNYIHMLQKTSFQNVETANALQNCCNMIHSQIMPNHAKSRHKKYHIYICTILHVCTNPLRG